MEKDLDNNIVREIAHMQSKIDTYEAFIMALFIMAKNGKKINYPMSCSTFGAPHLMNEMRTLWRFVYNHKPTQLE
jgi:phage terminase large subunit-like protein